MSSSSSTSTVTASTVAGTTRITGLSSNLDVDSIVEQLVAAEKEKKLNKLQQKEQLATWKQEAYREIISDVQSLASKYFSTDTTSTTSLLNSKNFRKYTVTSSNSAVSATYTGTAVAGSHTVAVQQLATAASRSSSGLVQNVKGGAAASYTSLSGKSVVLTVDGTDYTVDLSSVTSAATLQTTIDSAVGENKLSVTDSSGVLTIAAATDSGVSAIEVSAPSSGTSGLSELGFAATGAVTSNRLDVSSADDAATLADIASITGMSYNTDGGVDLTINGVSFSFDKDDKLYDIIQQINKSDCGATMKYDETSGELVLTADNTGAGATLTLSESGTSTFLTSVLKTTTAGNDSVAYIDGTKLTRSKNTYTLDGVTYTLNATTADSDTTIDSDEKVTVSLTQDVDAIYDVISNFVEDYNSLLSTINGELTEESDSDYPPLTDDQKADMTDEEIEKWETKAKSGLLESDSLLTNMLRELRESVSDSISGLSTTLFDIGIDTGDYSDKGKLYIDEDALKEAIQSDPDGVANLFCQQSTSYSGTGATARKLTTSQNAVRYKEEGLAYRFYDVLSKYTTTYVDSGGNKGLLIEKAGLEDDSTESDNYLSDAIEKYEAAIEDEEDRLDDYQTSLYNKYATLETYINSMNTQLTALQSYLSS